MGSRRMGVRGTASMLLIAGGVVALVVLMVDRDGTARSARNVSPQPSFASDASPAPSRPAPHRVQRIKPVPVRERTAGDPRDDEHDAGAQGRRIRGEGVDHDLTPARHVVEVAVFEMNDVTPSSRPVASASADDEGRFEIVRPSADSILVAFQPGRRPATLELPRGAPDSGRTIRLVLGKGAAI